ncbi:MAG: energy-coupling factor transport system substrate-specific component [Sphingomonadales bacterium]|jgi:energy-coupling factor transport system substrate-specific component|nr:energy-coupling factor transport system substrate-specific component [Sphingomonadales bacterium]
MTFTNRQIALMGMLIAFNLAIGGLVHVIKLPIFLDAIGTIIAAVLLRPVAAIVVGVFSFLIAAAIINPVYVWFIGTQAVIALAVYFAAKHLGIFRSLVRVIPAGIILGVITGIVSAPVIVYVFGGVAGSGRDLLTAALMSTGQQIWRAVFLSGAASEPLDKLLQMLAAFFILRSLPRKVLEPFRNPVLERNNLL